MTPEDRLHELETVLDALSNVQAIIHFDRDGKILKANENFCKTVGYREDEIVGQHHKVFVAPDYARGPEYEEFWQKLRAGMPFVGQFPRVRKGGGELFLEASYIPLRSASGDVDRVVKFAMDVTEREVQRAKMLSSVTQTAHEISTEAETMKEKSSDLSKRSEHQAATVEETSAAMEEISQTVASNVKNAEQATDEAQRAKQQAERGSDVVENAIAAMKKIENGSKEIRKFIEVIDSIAFQTNLLALNAGVEAARAGDAGRGFAVVASEVRALAQRASESAKDINTLIDNSTREVDEGARLVNETGAVLTEITEGVAKVADGIASIFAASKEQAAGIQEVNQAISTIDKDTQRNAAMSGESAIGAETLSQAAKSLLGAITHVGGAQTGGARPEVAAHPRSADRPADPGALREARTSRLSSFSREPASAPPVATPTSSAQSPLRLQRKVAVNESPVTEDDDDGAWTEF